MRQNRERTGPLFLVLIALLLIGSARKGLAEMAPSSNTAKLSEGLLSTNWVALAKAALPANYTSKGMLGFQETTNLLCQESRSENYAAQGLWGFALVVGSRSAEATKEGLRLMRSAGEHGCIPAMLHLGGLFEEGRFVRTDRAEAFRWYDKAASTSDPDAECRVGRCCEYGLGVKRDLEKSARYYLFAAEQTSYLAMRSIGRFLMDGVGIKQDLKAGRYWLERAAKEGGSRRAMYNLGVLCAEGAPETNALAEAFGWFRQSAELGDPLACAAVSNYYSGGWGVESNLDNSRAWRMKGANLGATDSQYRMGVAYMIGDGVPKNEDVALAWYLKAAKKNHPRALSDLAKFYLRQGTNPVSKSMANIYLLRAAETGHREAQFIYAVRCFRGDTGRVNQELGSKWLAKAVDNGWGPAELYLSQLYYQGISPAPGCRSYPTNVAEGVKLVRRAAEHKDLQAQTTLAYLLLHGTDVPPDKLEGERLMRDAAEHGIALAQNNLGYSMSIGLTSSSNLVEAGVWCRLAALNTTDPSVAKRAMVNESSIMWNVTDDQWIEVERKVKAFHPIPFEPPDALMKGWESQSNYRSEDFDPAATRLELKWLASSP